MATEIAHSIGGLLLDLNDEELLALTASKNRPGLKEWLDERIKRMWCKVSYNQTRGIVPLVKRAVGMGNLRNINRDITSERFPLKGTGVRRVLCRVEAYLNGETAEQAAKRLTDAGHILGSTGDLAGFLHDHPEEVAKWGGGVFAINKDSRWANPDSYLCVPCASVNGAHRNFGLDDFRYRRNSHNGILVLCESGT